MALQDGRKGTQLFCVSGREDCLREQQRVQELEVSEARFQNLFEAVKDAIVSVDRAGVVLRANSACADIFGWPRQGVVGKQLKDLFCSSALIVTAFQRTLDGGVQSLEQPVAWPNGREQTLDLQFSPIHDGQNVSGVLLVARDLTEVKLREAERLQLYDELQVSHQALEEKARALEESQQQLQQAIADQEKVNAELRELGRLKSDFIGIASHELRTPLTFLLGALQYLQESLPEKLADDERGLLDYAMQGADRLSKIVEDMLDIVRLETESFEPQRQPLELYPLLAQIRDDLAWTLQQRNLTLCLADERCWPQLLGDQTMIRRALEDVIENAIKYTEDGGWIRIEGRLRTPASLMQDAERIKLFWPEFPDGLSWSGDFFEIDISDNGIGIPRQELTHVFERFYTVGKLEEHASGGQFRGRGAGLGLALVKRIVRGHDGLVWAESPVRQDGGGSSQPGSCIHLLLPLAAQGGEDVLEVQRSCRLPRILLIDDEPAIRRFVGVLLRESYEVEMAESGASGLSKAASFRPDLILLDLHMQGMDGFEVCKRLKQDSRMQHIPVAMFTALSRQHEREKSMAAGAVAYITKPFFPRELLQRIEQLLKEHVGELR